MDFCLELLDGAGVLGLDSSLPVLQFEYSGAEDLDALLLAEDIAVGLLWYLVDNVLLFFLAARGLRFRI
jgi:hypothetical protein